MADKNLEKNMQAHFDEQTQKRAEEVTTLNHTILHNLKDRQINVDGFDGLFFNVLAQVCGGDLDKTKRVFSEALAKFDRDSRKFGGENFSNAELEFFDSLKRLIPEHK